VPLFVFGLSLGGATAYLLTLKHRSLFEGAILQAPALMPAMEMSKYFTSIRNICKFM
jgi:alpha-beta hydrolase superfamily lysophospholipase